MKKGPAEDIGKNIGIGDRGENRGENICQGKISNVNS